jgi:hypothetical protein
VFRFINPIIKNEIYFIFIYLFGNLATTMYSYFILMAPLLRLHQTTTQIFFYSLIPEGGCRLGIPPQTASSLPEEAVRIC